MARSLTREVDYIMESGRNSRGHHRQEMEGNEIKRAHGGIKEGQQDGHLSKQNRRGKGKDAGGVKAVGSL